jgi:hypothetical protein
MPILSFLGKHEGRGSARRTSSTGSMQPARYRCAECGRPRSSTYHSKHPPEEPPPPQGVCRRCIRKEQQKVLPPATTVYEFHHYHHACACKQEQACPRIPVEPLLCPAYVERAELPAEEKKDRPVSLQLFEEAPPPVRWETKPCYWSD